MSLQVTSGYRSLVALGIGISDVATIVSLSKRCGNWMTAASGDNDFLKFLDQDELEILRRRGLIDIARFNKRWGYEMALLTNGKPTVYKGDMAEKVLEKFGRFTAIMVCIVAAMDAFATSDLVKSTLRQVLLTLLRTTDYGADILASQYPHRLNSWRSSTTLRGLAATARQIRRDLLNQNLIADGLMPQGDSPHMVNFLVWLLMETSEEYSTQSSDVAGVAICLSELGIDILSVEGLRESPPIPTSCRVFYNRDAVMQLSVCGPSSDAFILSRFPCTTVSLKSPEESLTNFPVDRETANRCRAAWVEGSRAAGSVACRPVIPPHEVAHHDDFKYIFLDIGNRPGRIRTEVHQLGYAHAFTVNKELCDGLEHIFQQESSATLAWLLQQTTESMAPDAEEWDQRRANDSQIWNFKMQDAAKVNAFTVFQAFFMGYFYGIFLRFVDTSALRIQTVDGAWGYRSPVFLFNIRNIWLNSSTVQEPGIRIFRRERVLGILAALTLGKPKDITGIKSASFNRKNWCLGVIEKNALLVRSLLKPCRTVQEVGSFIMLDVDVSGIPVDLEGLVRPGVPTKRLRDHVDSSLSFKPSWDTITSKRGICPEDVEDATFHIEADWDGDPQTMLLCVRFKGRRIETINPATADNSFLQCLVPPTSNAKESASEMPTSLLSDLVEWSVTDLLNNCLAPLPGIGSDRPPIMRLSLAGRPRLRYYAVEAYRTSNFIIRVATDSLEKAFASCWKATGGSRWQPLVVISGNEADCLPTRDDWVSEDVAKKITSLQTKSATVDRTSNQLLGENDIVLTVGRSQPETYLFVKDNVSHNQPAVSHSFYG